MAIRQLQVLLTLLAPVEQEAAILTVGCREHTACKEQDEEPNRLHGAYDSCQNFEGSPGYSHIFKGYVGVERYSSCAIRCWAKAWYTAHIFRLLDETYT